MATVEQCETQPSVLASVSDTLKLYDTFKSPQDEEKDSDEESFHLPMMDCDEDLEAKESLTSGPSKVITDETEDEILNKFETNGTPDIDPKMEDSLLLEEIDNLFEKKGSESTNITNNDKDNQSDTNSKDIPIVDKEDNTVSETLESVDDMTVSVEKVISKEIDINKEDEKIENINKEDEGIENITEMKENEQTDNITDPEIVIKDVNQETEVDNKSENKDNIIDNIHDNKMDVDSQESEITNCKENIESTTTKEDTIPTETAVKENKENDVIESNQHNLNLDQLNTLSTDTETKVTTTNHSDTSLEVPSNVQLMETDNIEETNSNVDTLQEALPQDNNLSDNLDGDGDISPKTTEKSDKDCKNDNFDENHLHKAITSAETTEKFEIDQQNDNSEENHLKETVAESVQNEETDPKAQNTNAPDKCENSNDSSKSNNLDCDDLLDISIIRDVDEDNASAIAENAKDAQASEKSDNDNEDQDEGSEKAENELDESEMDQDDTLLANDKEDNMDFEDGSSNLCDQENLISENTSDSDSKGNPELRDLEDSSKDVSVSNDMSDVNETELNGEKSSEEETLQMKDTESDVAAEGNQDSNKENLTKTNGKRSLSETDIADSVNKKIKLTAPQDKIHKTSKTKTLISFERYMQNKKLESKLTRSDLEQFCLQKICEAIMHKTDVGELHQTIKKQEQIIETLRKDLQQLTKQTRDLDIVNKKLMNELRTQNGTKKPLVPLKITRSVGLQVKLNTTNDINNRRKVATPTTPRTPANNNSTPARARTVAPNASVVRQVTNATRKPPNAAPLLSQALQTRQATPNTTTKRPPIRPKPAEPQKPANASVIDLTDEDDKASKGAVGSASKTVSKTVSLSNGKTINIIPAKTVANKTMNSNQSKTVAVGQVKTTNSVTKVGTPTRTVAALPQGVRLTPTQVKSGSIAIPAGVVTSNSGTTQLMYVVQPGSVVTSTAGGTQKAVLLNIQPTNGVLAPTLNGSAVSVLPSKTSNSIQLKTVLPTPRKHPAPLPSPPPTMHSSSLKPPLPKPHLSIRKTDTGIILQWRMPYNLELYEAIASYQLFAYQETSAAPSTEMWRKVGDVKALALPMACTLTQFADKNKYYFAVRSIDVHKRIGAFSDPEEISL